MPPRALEPAGIVLVDKPAGPSSFAIVAELRRKTGARTGHAGTLDPFATGLLLLLSGSATKLASCFVGLGKRYLTEIDLTARTSTGDPEGVMVETKQAPPEDEVEQRLAGLRGEVELPIPAASAVKIGGERAYKLARRGIAVEMPLRRSRVDALDVIAYTGDLVQLDLRVSSGTYVRAMGALMPNGANRNVPAVRSSNVPKMLGESKRGTHSQSTAPSGQTSAPVWQSERKA